MLRLMLAGLFVALLSLATSPRIVRASYDWCSVDPLHQFRLPESPSPSIVHVRIAIPQSAAPIDTTAQLIVITHAAIPAVERSSTPEPLLPLSTTFTSDARSEYDRVDYYLIVPTGQHSAPFLVSLTVNQPGYDPLEVIGMSGQTIHLPLTLH